MPASMVCDQVGIEVLVEFGEGLCGYRWIAKADMAVGANEYDTFLGDAGANWIDSWIVRHQHVS